MVDLLARKVFKFSREWAAPLASGISICGVSAAIATASAIRARPVVPVMVSSLVGVGAVGDRPPGPGVRVVGVSVGVGFAVVGLPTRPFAARAFLSHEPMVAAAWMGL